MANHTQEELNLHGGEGHAPHTHFVEASTQIGSYQRLTLQIGIPELDRVGGRQAGGLSCGRDQVGAVHINRDRGSGGGANHGDVMPVAIQQRGGAGRGEDNCRPPR